MAVPGRNYQLGGGGESSFIKFPSISLNNLKCKRRKPVFLHLKYSYCHPFCSPLWLCRRGRPQQWPPPPQLRPWREISFVLVWNRRLVGQPAVNHYTDSPIRLWTHILRKYYLCIRSIVSIDSLVCWAPQTLHNLVFPPFSLFASPCYKV
jgi:hypothetical protein